MPIEMLPAGIFLLGAVIAACSSPRVAALTALATPIISAFAALSVLAPGATASWSIMTYDLELVRADHLNLIMVGLFHVAALAAAIYAFAIRDRLQHTALLAYIGSGIGAVLAGDFITLFVFFELIGLSGTLLVLSGRTPQATAAAIRYLVFQVTAGLALLTGALVLNSATGDWRFGHIGLDSPGGWLILLAFGIKSGFPLLHGWIVDAYPKASLTGLAVLVAVTTKVGIYGLARGFAGESVLIPIGTVMALWPLFYALVENDLRRVLAYTMMVQLGLMVAAIGVGSGEALDGAMMHLTMDVMFKMTLFMALGVVLHRVGTTRSDRLGGLWKAMPVTTACATIAVAANVAMPLTGGFISKKLLLAGIEHSDTHPAIWLTLFSMSALGMLYAGVRILWEGFLRPTEQPRDGLRDAPWTMVAGMLVPIAVIFYFGLIPDSAELVRPHGSDYWPLKAGTVVGHLQMLAFALLTYLVLHRIGFGLPPSRPGRWRDTERIYRNLVPATAVTILMTLTTLRNRAIALFRRLATPALGYGRLSTTLARTWPVGSMALWVAVLLAALLIFGIRQG